MNVEAIRNLMKLVDATPAGEPECLIGKPLLRVLLFELLRHAERESPTKYDMIEKVQRLSLEFAGLYFGDLIRTYLAHETNIEFRGKLQGMLMQLEQKIKDEIEVIPDGHA